MAAIHQVTTTFAVFRFRVEPVVDVMDAVAAEVEAIKWRDSLRPGGASPGVRVTGSIGEAAAETGLEEVEGRFSRSARGGRSGRAWGRRSRPVRPSGPRSQ